MEFRVMAFEAKKNPAPEKTDAGFGMELKQLHGFGQLKSSD